MKAPRIFWFLLFSCGLSQPVLAHGARINYQQTSAIVIQATYDDGTPMAEAQAIVYAPDEPTTPWLKGMTDESGKFIFTLDPDLSGNWDIKVRQGGHGDIISIPVTAGAIAESNPDVRVGAVEGAGYSPGQKILMAIAGVWGFIGTALFFSRK